MRRSFGPASVSGKFGRITEFEKVKLSPNYSLEEKSV